MRFIKYILLLFYFTHTSSSSLATQQVEEGWRWKKTFLLQTQESAQQYSIDHVHNQMADNVSKIYQMLSNMTQELEAVIPKLRQLLKDKDPLKLIFASLNSDDKSIDDILRYEDVSDRLKDYWLGNKDFQTLPPSNEQVLHIIRQNLQRLSTRNIVLAEIGTIIKGKYENKPIFEPQTGRRAVFLSGTGNRLIELLELTYFHDYIFITFDRPYGEDRLYDGFLKGNLVQRFIKYALLEQVQDKAFLV